MTTVVSNWRAVACRARHPQIAMSWSSSSDGHQTLPANQGPTMTDIVGTPLRDTKLPEETKYVVWRGEEGQSMHVVLCGGGGEAAAGRGGEG